MSASEKMSLSSMRKTIAVAVSAVVIVAAGWASVAAATSATGLTAASTLKLATRGLDAAVGAPTRAANSSMISGMPAYCCPGYSPGGAQGLTTYGQASVKGQGTAARDAAIAKAIADATDQAKAAAAAAGITLGKIIDLQVSAPYFGYAEGIAVGGGTATKGAPIPPSTGMESGVATGVSSTIYSGTASSGAGSAPAAGSSVGGSTVCPDGASCPVILPAPMPVETFASVTITWAID